MTHKNKYLIQQDVKVRDDALAQHKSLYAIPTV
jgi:hypothetical protein